MLAQVIGLCLLGLLALFVVFTYNRLVRLRVHTQNAWSGIDVQLRRRYDLIPNVVETVKGYAAHERELFEAVTRARAEAVDASGVRRQAEAENQLTQSLRRLFAVAEAYPQLRASQNYLALQEELSGTESKIAFSRQFYNDQVAMLNTLIQSFPSSLVASVFRFRPREFFEIDERSRGPVPVQS
ncbi:LemA family protein [soil metagenome]